MQKLTDAEMNYMRNLRTLGLNKALDLLVGPAIDKLLANYLEALEAEGACAAYVATERYTEANVETTLLSVDFEAH